LQHERLPGLRGQADLLHLAPIARYLAAQPVSDIRCTVDPNFGLPATVSGIHLQCEAISGNQPKRRLCVGRRIGRDVDGG
jgi:hypothetical protein